MSYCKSFSAVKCSIGILLLCLIFNESSVGQASMYFKKLTKENGLSQSSVFAISEDANGFLWFGTRDGLNKYDGYQFTVYRKKEDGNGPVGNDIRFLYNDSLKNKLWIGTLEGLSSLDLSSNRFTNFAHDKDDSLSIASDHISAILRDKQGRLWIGTSGGLCIYQPELNGFKTYKLPETSANNNITDLLEAKDGNLWIGTRSGLLIFDPDEGSFRYSEINSQQTSHNIMCLSHGVGDVIWIGTEKAGLLKLNESGQLLATYQATENKLNSLSNNLIRSICLDEKKRLWVGTFDGLNLLDDNELDFSVFKNESPLNNSLNNNSIQSLYVDRKGSLWIGTYYGGVNHLDEGYNIFQNIEYSPYGNGLKAPVVSSFAEDAKGNLWIGTEGGGLNFYNRLTEKYENLFFSKDNGRISGNNVKQLLLDDPYLWIGYFNKGLDRLDLRTKEIKNYDLSDGLSNLNVYGILKEENRLWLGTYAGGLNIMNLETGEFKVYEEDSQDENSLSSNFIRVVYKTSLGEIWLGTSKGINKVVRQGSDLPSQFKSYLEDYKIYSIAEDSSGNLWIGTISNGLFRFSPNTEEFKNYSTNDGLAGNSVFGILKDEKGYLWLSTNNGISRFCKDDEQFINFNSSNGLSNSEYNFNAYYKLRNGNFLFGGVNGYTKFDPQQVVTSEFVPSIVLTGIYQNNEPLQLDQNINEIEQLHFKYNEANFTIHFAALDYSNPADNHYAYQLEGLDNDWKTVIGQPYATYTIQRHGSYTFKLKGSNNAGRWNEEVRTLEIIVLPPPWRTWWAYLLYFGLICLGIYAIIRYLRLRDSLELERKEKKREDEIHQLKLNFFTNVAHEFRTPLTLIIAPLNDLIKNLKSFRGEEIASRLHNINEHAQRMLNLVNQLMTFRKMEAGYEPLQVEEVNLNEFLYRVHNLFSDHAKLLEIKYVLNLPEQSVNVFVDVEKMEKVLTNLLSNAFKFTPHGGSIVLKLIEGDEGLVISLQDSGPGISKDQQLQIFQRFYEKTPGEAKNLIKGSGIGLALSKELVELHHGKLSVESDNGQGSTFFISLLKGKQHFKQSEIIAQGVSKTISKAVEIESVIDKDFKSIASPETNLKVLLVDDNPEILDYLTSIFKGKHKVITANNGEEGLKKAKSFDPDLIISDVMMPIMSGIDFCNAIREDIETSHIPFILLTAKTTLEDRLSGLSSGANDYISKPFHPDELRLKVDNLLSQRRRIKENIGKDTFTPSELEVTSADEEFLQKLIDLVEANIDNADFKIEQFAHELAVSRALLFTKMKALTDMTPKNFLKSFRMKRAVQLLETGKLNVHEVAYMVGYKDPKYFSKVFQKEIGQNPSEYTVEFRV